jgi:transcription termination factor Rho
MSEEVKEQETEQQEAPKPRRGRPRKTAPAAEIKPEDKAQPAAKTKSAPKARTSKEEKSATQEVSSANEEPAAQIPTKASAEADEPAPAKPRRRRTRKAADVKPEDASAEANTDGTADAPKEANAEAATEAATEAPKETENEDAHAAEEKSDDAAEDKHDDQNSGDQNNGSNNRRRKRNRQGREYNVPSISKEDIYGLNVADLKAKAKEMGIDYSDLKKKDQLAARLFETILGLEGFIIIHGILDIMSDGYGFVRTTSYLPGENDVYVATSFIKRSGLRRGDEIVGYAVPPREKEKYGALHALESVNGMTPEEARGRVRFSDLTPIFPDERLTMEHAPNAITARVIDLVAPIGKGQRGLIVSPPKAGKTTVLKDIAAAITANNPDVHLMCLLVDERPEEVTDMERSIKGEVISSTFDMPCENHITVSELVIERAKRLVELGQDVVILLDSLTRLARAYNLAQPASGRILSGGVDSTALYPPKRFLGAARNMEGGGSLTILASALIETGSKMDEVIFEEFKGTGNMELKLDRSLADRRIFPAIDPISSGTRKEELLLNSQEQPLVWGLRRVLAAMPDTQRAMDTLVKNLKQTQTNQEFLIRAARKANQDKFEI